VIIVQNLSYRVNTPSVVSETIDGEVIIINLEAGHYYSLNNAVGVHVWSAIDAGHPIDAITAALSDHYAETSDVIGATVTTFVDELATEGLIVAAALDDKQNTIVLSADNERVFAAPTLQKFTDMQDLLLLDPIHEVDETGWPLLPTAADEKESVG